MDDKRENNPNSEISQKVTISKKFWLKTIRKSSGKSLLQEKKSITPLKAAGYFLKKRKDVTKELEAQMTYYV